MVRNTTSRAVRTYKAMKHPSYNTLLTIAACLSAAAAMPSHAVEYRANNTGFWDVGTNWEGNVKPTGFARVSNGTRNNSIITLRTVESLVGGGSVGRFIFGQGGTGSSLTIVSGGSLTTDGTTAHRIGQTTAFTLTLEDGGSLNVPNSQVTSAAASTFTATGGFASFGRSYNLSAGSVMNLSGSADINVAQALTFDNSSLTISDSVDLDVGGGLTLTSGSTASLQGGTLRVNAINNAGNTFNWGEGTLTVHSNNASGTTDRSSPGFGSVYEGTSLTVSGDITTSGAQDSTLDLGSLFINSGVRYNQLSVTGALDLNGSDDQLNFDINPYFLRPNVGLAQDSGSLTLVEAGTLSGAFETFGTVLQDNIGWSEFTGTFNPGDTGADLPVNTYYLETTTGAGGSIVFHYKVSGSVPEPGTAGLALLGILLVRSLRDTRRKSRS